MLLHTSPVTHTQALRNIILIQAPAFTQRLSHTEALTHSNNIHTHTHGCLLHTDSFSLRADACTPVLSHTHTGSFTRRSLYTPALSHTGTFTHRSFYTHTRKHTHTHTMIVAADAFTHGSSDTHTHTHPKKNTPRKPFMQKLLHADAFAHRKLLHANPFTRRCLYAQMFLRRMLLHTDGVTHTFTHRCLETQAPLHIEALHTDRFTQRTPLHTLLIE